MRGPGEEVEKIGSGDLYYYICEGSMRGFFFHEANAVSNRRATEIRHHCMYFPSLRSEVGVRISRIGGSSTIYIYIPVPLR